MPVPEDSVNIAVRHQVLLERLKSGFYSDFNEVLNRLDRGTQEALMSLDVDKISQLSKRDLGVLIAELRTLTNDLLTEQVESFTKDLEKLSKAETKFEVDSIKEVTIKTAVSTPPAGSAFTFANNLPIRATGTLPKKFFGMMTRNEQDKLEAVIRKGWVDGATIPEMVQRVKGTRISNFQDGFTKQAKARVEAQVRTATQHYSSASREKVWVDNSEIIEGYQWVSTLDSRTTQQCRSLDGRVFEVGDGPMPPIHYNCLLGDALITASHGISRIFKRVFEGKLVTIKTSSGNTISTTPNHPILTRLGWVAAQNIKLGSECVVQSNIQDIVSVDGNDYRIGSTIEDIAESFSASSQVSTSEMPVTAPDFHGDGTNEEIGVVWSYRGLGDVRYSINIKEGGKSSLIIGDSRKVLRTSLSMLDKLTPTPLPTSCSDVSGLSHRSSLLGATSSHSCELLSGSVSDFDSVFSKDSLYGSWADTESIGNPTNTDTGGVFFDDVVSVEVSDFSGHVYNLETDTHCVNANGFVTHNCRSTTVADLDDDLAFLDEGATRSARGPSGKSSSVDADETYYSWLKKQPKNFQDVAIGPTRGKLLRDGGLSADAFAEMNLGRNFQPLSLEAMAKDHAVVFEKAGVPIPE